MSTLQRVRSFFSAPTTPDTNSFHPSRFPSETLTHSCLSPICLGFHNRTDQEFKKLAVKLQPDLKVPGELPSYQTLVLGLVSGAMGPFSNAPIDTIKTCVLSLSLRPFLPLLQARKLV